MTAQKKSLKKFGSGETFYSKKLNFYNRGNTNGSNRNNTKGN